MARKAKKSTKSRKSSKKRKTSKKRAKAVTSRRASAKRSSKRSSKKRASAKRSASARKPAGRKAAGRRKSAKRATRDIPGEGNYTASRKFLNDQSGFVKRNRKKISAMGKQAEQALEGPEGDALREAEEEAKAHSHDGPEI